MKADRFFSVPYDIRSDTKIVKLRIMQGGMAALGRWVALLGILYDEGGIVDLLEDFNRRMLAAELDMDDAQLQAFLEDCAAIGLIDKEFWNMGKVASRGVTDQLAFKAKQKENGQRGGRPKTQSKTHSKTQPKTQTETQVKTQP